MPDPAPDLPLLRPPQRKVPLGQAICEIPKLFRIGPSGLFDLLRAVAELALARYLLARRSVRQLGIPGKAPTLLNGAHSFVPLSAEQRAIVARISYAMQVAPPRVPWRSDCLVQCLAARRWLGTLGIPARVSIGVKREAEGPLLAHAWLVVDDMAASDTVVTGGDLSGFSEFQVPPSL